MTFHPDIFVRFRDAYRSRYEPESARVLAGALWRIALALSLLFAAAGIAYGIQGFAGALGAPGAKAGEARNASQGRPSISRAAIEATLSGFDARGARFESLETNPPAFADPSF